MAIDTNNKKLAVMEFGDIWEPGLPISPSTLGQDDQQQLLWGYPGILWSAAAALAFVLDLNTRLAVYLRDFYSQPTGEVTTLSRKYLNEEVSGDMNVRFRQMVTNANTAMGA
jgi:hypothetical protein